MKEQEARHRTREFLEAVRETDPNDLRRVVDFFLVTATFPGLIHAKLDLLKPGFSKRLPGAVKKATAGR